MIKLRYHHLMCVPRFSGKGYSSEFCNNMQKIKESMQFSEFTLVEECDDICAACPNNIGGICREESTVSRYDKMVKDALERGEAPQPEKICCDCVWYGICKNIKIP